MAFTIVSDKCECLGECRRFCPVDCIELIPDGKNAAGISYSAIEPTRCIDCGACRSVCPVPGAILNEWRPDLQRTIPEPPFEREGISREEEACRQVADLEVALAIGSIVNLRKSLGMQDLGSALELAPHLLHLAACLGETDCCRALIEYGYPIDAQDAAGETPLISAIRRRHPRQMYLDDLNRDHPTRAIRTLSTCRLLLGTGADLDKADLQKRTPLHHAALAVNDGLIWLLAGWGARIDPRDAHDRTPLHLAAEREAAAEVAALLASGADPSLLDKNDETLLALALRGEFVTTAAALIFASGPPDVPQHPLALHALAFAESLDRLQRAIAQGADLNVRDPRGRTALHWAAMAGRAGSVALLLDAGARTDLLDVTGASVADYGLCTRLSERQREAFAIAFRIDGP